MKKETIVYDEAGNYPEEEYADVECINLPGIKDTSDKDEKVKQNG